MAFAALQALLLCSALKALFKKFEGQPRHSFVRYHRWWRRCVPDVRHLPRVRPRSLML
jgi:hypothetical protein